MPEPLRSLERESSYAIFAPLDPVERLPRELLFERPTRHLWGSELDWRHFAGAAWIPALVATLSLSMWQYRSAVVALAMAGLLLIAFKLVAFNGPP
jgi:hypothetical protein